MQDLLHLDIGDWHPRVGYRNAALQREKKQGVTGFDALYQLLLEDGFLPGKTAPFPSKVLTRELYQDMQDRVPELRFVAQNQVGTYFGQARFKQLGLKPWRISEGNGWEFPRLADLRREWEQRQGGWEWPNDLSEWTFNPSRQDE